MEALANMSKEQAYQFTAGASQAMMNKQFRIAHLTSNKGQLLNGKICRVSSFISQYRTNPDMRLGCTIRQEDGTESNTPISFKACNLVSVEGNIMQNLMSASEPLSDEKIIQGLKQGLQQHEGGGERGDLNHRINLYKNALKDLEVATNSKRSGNSNGNALEDDQYCLPCGASPAPDDNENTFDWAMRTNKPACVGNNKLDLRLMDLGLKGDGVATCDICTLTLDTSETRLVTLPCVHQFHTSCIEEWLQSDLGRRNWNCPTCRHIVPNNLTTYMIRYEAELRNRFQEFLLSGFCHKCILWIMERIRNEEIPALDESGEQMTMNQVGQMQEKIYAFPPSE